MDLKHETKTQDIDVLIKHLQHIQKNVIPMDRTDLSIIKHYPKVLNINIIRNENHEIIGFLAWKEIGFWNKKAYITSIAILPKYQNKGYGSKLLTFTINQIRKTTNLKEIEVDTWKANNKALQFYLKHGFHVQKVENENITLLKSLKEEILQ
jgi:ribosomal protein S18 acetylase RimI-like enzyme